MNWLAEVMPDVMGKLSTHEQERERTRKPCTTCPGDAFFGETTCGSCQWKKQEEDIQRRLDDSRRRNILATIPAGMHWATFDDPNLASRVSDKRHIDRARSTANAKRVVLLGPAGAGKTSLGVAMIQEAARLAGPDEYPPGVFCHAYRLGTCRIQTAAGTGESPLVVQAMRADVLLIDDLGSERQTQNNAVPDVLFERHAEDRSTWITTGLSAKQIAERYGDGIARRVFEHAVIINLGKTE